ncbi:MAG: hypothetical protein ACOYD0_05125 [Candidatus Nanopelagicales bacterium]
MSVVQIAAPVRGVVEQAPPAAANGANLDKASLPMPPSAAATINVRATATHVIANLGKPETGAAAATINVRATATHVIANLGKPETGAAAAVRAAAMLSVMIGLLVHVARATTEQPTRVVVGAMPEVDRRIPDLVRQTHGLGLRTLGAARRTRVRAPRIQQLPRPSSQTGSATSMFESFRAMSCATLRRSPSRPSLGLRDGSPHRG